MEAIILAGGKGTRLKDVIRDIPKPMAPIHGKPFLEYLVMQLTRWNIRDIVLSVGYKYEIIQNYFQDGKRWHAHIRYSVENSPLGTGGAIRESARLINGDDFLVMNGDSYFDLDFETFHSFHLSKESSLSLALAAMDDTGRYGRVVVNNFGKVLGFKEKCSGGCGLINSGVYLFNHNALPIFPPGNISLEQHILPQIVDKGLYAVQHNVFFIDIGIPEDYLFLSGHYSSIPLSCHSTP
jgi:D-glycero-alpha-D-manno-heptose 1-phosphate guanylyltransferase